MKANELFLLAALAAAIDLIAASRVTAQIFTTLHAFDGHGATPWANLILSGSTLYGTTAGKGSWGDGTIFAIKTDGTEFTNLYSFTATSNNTNNDGAGPIASLVLSGGILYGTAADGGAFGNGTVFAVNTDGTGFTNLHNFGGYPTDGANPWAGLVLSGNSLYGTALNGGSSDFGTVFVVNIDGKGFKTLHGFTGEEGNPWGGLLSAGNTLYGTTSGAVFAINPDGTGFTNVHLFTAASTNSLGVYTNSDGLDPRASLILSGNTLYGTALGGGSSGAGTVFAVGTDGAGFRTLHTFGYNSSDEDGVAPWAGLILLGNTLYGTALGGGSSGVGTLFGLSTDGTGFTNLHNFNYSNGNLPYAGLVRSGNTLYGTASDYFNDFLYGTVFSLSFPPPQLTITPSETSVILAWPANVAGFDYSGYILQSTTNLVSLSVWSTNSTVSVPVNGQITVTNLISGPRNFFRLSQ
jgi:uncharacterized repeat protein (TIGR03803 family)